MLSKNQYRIQQESNSYTLHSRHGQAFCTLGLKMALAMTISLVILGFRHISAPSSSPLATQWHRKPLESVVRRSGRYRPRLVCTVKCVCKRGCFLRCSLCCRGCSYAIRYTQCQMKGFDAECRHTTTKLNAYRNVCPLVAVSNVVSIAAQAANVEQRINARLSASKGSYSPSHTQNL